MGWGGRKLGVGSVPEGLVQIGELPTLSDRETNSRTGASVENRAEKIFVVLS